jgi:hypothetical protein
VEGGGRRPERATNGEIFGKRGAKGWTEGQKNSGKPKQEFFYAFLNTHHLESPQLSPISKLLLLRSEGCDL